MAQKSKNNKPRKAQAYSADSMALHLVGGLVLIALGVMIFLAVARHDCPGRMAGCSGPAPCHRGGG